MPLRRNRKVLLVKEETTFNVDSTPDAANDAILAEEIDYQVDFVSLERNFLKPTWSRTAHASGRKLAKVTFMTEIKGGGTAGDQCDFGKLLTFCGFKETLSPGVSATYDPTSDPAEQKSATIYVYIDGVLHVMTGCYGTVSMEAEVNGFGKASFEFTGQYYAPTDVALPAAPTYESQKPQQFELAQFAANGYSGVISRFNIDMGLNILPRLDANGADGYNGTYIDDRNPTGGFDPEAVLVADEDFWDALAQATEMAFTVRVGTTAGNTVTITSANIQYTGLTYSTRDNIQTYDAGIAFNDAGSGDDELQIVIT